MSQERTRFPVTPQERHRTAQSFDDVKAVPEENIPQREERPQDKPPPPTRATQKEDRDDDRDHDHRDEEDEEHEEDDEGDGIRRL